MQDKLNSRKSLLVSLISVALAALLGCNGLTFDNSSSTTQSGPQTYMAPVVAGSTINKGIFGAATSALATYTIDDDVTPGTFSQSTTSFSGTQQGTTITNSGSLSVLARGLRSLETTYAYNPGTGTVNNSLTQTGSYAVELAGQAGGVVQLLGQAATPIVATPSCPSYPTEQTFQFITLPAAVISTTVLSDTWNPVTQTAFGSVSVVSSGTDFTFNNIQQFTLPVNGGAPGMPTASYETTATGTCSSTAYGYVISSPADVTINYPGGVISSGQIQSETAAAAIGIGPTGLLVEDNGNGTNNLLGAGTGAIGVPLPASALDTSAVVGAQYLGFVYNPGNGSSATGWSSTLASFGFTTVPSGCPSVTASTSLIYGGDLTATQTSGDGYGNCNLAIDLGPESTTSYGLYLKATVTMTTGFPANTTGKTNTFNAVAVVGQLQGKYVLLLIGKDATQAWSLYLMQSN